MNVLFFLSLFFLKLVVCIIHNISFFFFFVPFNSCTKHILSTLDFLLTDRTEKEGILWHCSVSIWFLPLECRKKNIIDKSAQPSVRNNPGMRLSHVTIHLFKTILETICDQFGFNLQTWKPINYKNINAQSERVRQREKESLHDTPV